MSKANALEFRYEWKIHNFSTDFYIKGEAIDSPTFEIVSFGGSQWFLRLFPRGEVERDCQHVSVFLYKKRSDIYSEVSNITYDLEFIGEDGKSLDTKSSGCQEFKLNSRHGFPRFWQVSTLNSYFKKWPVSILTLRCSMFDMRKQRLLDCVIHTEIPVKQSSFLWNIKVGEISSQTISKEFSFSEKSLYAITLSMLDDDNTIKICIHQREEESPFKKFVKCKLSLINSKKNELFSKCASHYFVPNEKNNVWNFESFIAENDLYSKSDLWEKGNFSLFCEFITFDSMKSSTPIISAKYAKSNGDKSSSLVKDIKSMLNDHIHSDIQLKAGKEVIHAHKAILAARSPVFLAMFDRNMLESQTGVVDIPDLEAKVLKTFLEFIYIGEVENLDYEKAKNLIMVADKYQVQSLKEKCASFLDTVLAVGNAIEILSIADITNHKHLKDSAMSIILLNSEVIFKTSEWHECVRENIKLASEIISVIADNFKIIPI